VMGSYLGGVLPAPAVVCPEDRARLSWRGAPRDMASSSYRPQKSINNQPNSNLDWWPYSTSYQLVAQACSPAAKTNPPYAQAASHDTYQAFNKAGFGTRKIDEVLFPSQKVALYDSQDRHTARQPIFFAYPDARQPLGFFDSSVSVRRTGDGNMGADSKRPGM